MKLEGFGIFVDDMATMVRFVSKIRFWKNDKPEVRLLQRRHAADYGTVGTAYLLHRRPRRESGGNRVVCQGVSMPFDFKKEYKEFYMPKGKPEIVTVPKMNYIAVRGKGNPNEEDGEYKK